MNIRDRIKEFRRIPAAQLIPDSRNFRRHSEAQAKAMRAVLTEVGYAGAVLAREDEHGEVVLIDGHLRAGIAETPGALIPVLVLDVTEAEAAKILATYDPLAGMASIDDGAFKTLLDGIEADSAAFATLLNDLRPADDVLSETAGGGGSGELAGAEKTESKLRAMTDKEVAAELLRVFDKEYDAFSYEDTLISHVADRLVRANRGKLV